MARPKKSDAPDVTQPIDLTAGAIDRLMCPTGKPQAFLRDSDTKGLRVRVTAAGAKAFVYERKLERKTIRRTIGDVSTWSIDQARVEARRLGVMLDGGTDPRELERKQRAAKETERIVQLEAEQYTLVNLLTAYCDYLKTLERKSHVDVRAMFKLHVVGAWPKVASMPANAVTSEQIADMMRRVIELGKDRTANKLRSYIRSAYQVAKAARSKPSIPLAFKAFNVRSNPAADTEPDEAANRADKNPLTSDEMRIYWANIRELPGFMGAALRLHLLTGGQRIEQLCGLRTANIGTNAITLMDTKGRPGKAPRPHTVPLIDAAATALQGCNPNGAYAISMNGGKSPLTADALSRWAVAASTGIAEFKAKRIRSGVETILASARISSDHRGRLQSHGIAGVQARHYDGHDYLDEKRYALETLFNLLKDPPIASGAVLQLKAA